MKNFNKILLITLLFALKFNTFSQVCNQSTLNPSADPNFTVITVNTTKTLVIIFIYALVLLFTIH